MSFMPMFCCKLVFFKFTVPDLMQNFTFDYEGEEQQHFNCNGQAAVTDAIFSLAMILPWSTFTQLAMCCAKQRPNRESQLLSLRVKSRPKFFRICYPTVQCTMDLQQFLKLSLIFVTLCNMGLNIIDLKSNFGIFVFRTSENLG